MSGTSDNKAGDSNNPGWEKLNNEDESDGVLEVEVDDDIPKLLDQEIDIDSEYEYKDIRNVIRPKTKITLSGSIQLHDLC